MKMKTGKESRKELIKYLKTIYKSLGVSPFDKPKPVAIRVAESDWNWHYTY